MFKHLIFIYYNLQTILVPNVLRSILFGLIVLYCIYMGNIKLSDTELVSAHIAKLDEPTRKIVEALRKIILSTDTEIAEEIKWNAPSFYYTGDIKPFDPKEYRRHIIVMNLHKRLLLVFPSGAKIDNASGLLTGDYKDGRRLVEVKTIEDVKEITPALQAAIKDWLSKVERS